MNVSWKIPCGFFLIDGMVSDKRASLIQTCIERLCNVGVEVVSLTCNGPSCHFSTMQHLGATPDPENMDPSFKHPCDPNKRVYALLDLCHMLKLDRNMLGDVQMLINKNGE